MNWRVAIITGVVVATGILIYLLAPILMPFAVSFVFAYIANPIVNKIQRWGLPRTLAVVIVFAVFGVLIVVAMFGLVPAIHRQLNRVAVDIPVYTDWVLSVAIPWLQSTFNFDFSVIDLDRFKQTILAHWQDVGSWLTTAILKFSETGFGFFGWLISILLIPLLSFYLLRDWSALLARIDALMTPAARPWLRQIAIESDQVLSSFMRGQLTVMFFLTIIYCVGLNLAGLDFALPIGMLAGAVSFVPYLGFIVGVLVAGIAAVLQYHDATILLSIFVVFLIGQLLEGFVLTPWLIGDRIGLHPVAVIFAVMAGGQLFGFLGVLLALPVAAVLVVLLRHLHGAIPDTKKKTSRKRSGSKQAKKSTAA